MKILSKMEDRLAAALEISDSEYFNVLLYYGELVTKLTCAGLVSAVVNGRDQQQYSLCHRLVRANGIGEWSSVIDELTTGPTSSHLLRSANDEQVELGKKVNEEHWQYKCVNLLYEAVRTVDESIDPLAKKVSARQWFSLFAYLRNKTRGHGAVPLDEITKCCNPLRDSIKLFVSNFSLFKREWAYLKQNLSGKYNVVHISELTNGLGALSGQKGKGTSLEEGVYVYFDQPRVVKLIISDLPIQDFFFPNGSFTARKCELLSYITGAKRDGNSKAYSSPPGELPLSDTRGLSGLDVQGGWFGNLPSRPNDYISRPELEEELRQILNDERNPMISLVGRGGIGKTSAALTVLHNLSHDEKYELAIWFSARDIDLEADRQLKVRPDILTIDDIAKQYVELTSPEEKDLEGFSAKDYFLNALATVEFGKPSIFIFDNFETTKDPSDLFQLLNSHIRLPNKIIITSRFRDFKGDYPIEVSGMKEEEAMELIATYSRSLGIHSKIKNDYKKKLYEQSDGHPYIIKVLLGEAKKSKQFNKIEKIIDNKDGMLDALFDRTYRGFSAAAKRIFITLCGWRSVIPRIAFEAVLLRDGNENIDLDSAIEELRNSSFIETHYSEEEQEFIAVPLTAQVFGRKKLAVSPYKISVKTDIDMLMLIGPTVKAEIDKPFSRKLTRLSAAISKRITKGDKFSDFVPIMEYVAKGYNKAWLDLAEMYWKINGDLENAKENVRNFLEGVEEEFEARTGWNKLAVYCEKSEDYQCQLQCLLELSALGDVEYDELSAMANKVNYLFRQKNVHVNAEEKRYIVETLAKKMEDNIANASADDCSRLAWLYLNIREENEAKRVCQRGLDLDSFNEHCCKLMRKLDGALVE